MTTLADIKREREADSIVQSRCDRRTIATLLEYFIKQGESITSISVLVRLSLEVFSRVLIDNGMTEGFESTDDATRFLDRIGISKINPSGRLAHTLTKKLGREALTLDGGDAYFIDHKITMKSMHEREKKDLMKEFKRLETSGVVDKIRRKAALSNDSDIAGQDQSLDEVKDRAARKAIRDKERKINLMNLPTSVDNKDEK